MGVSYAIRDILLPARELEKKGAEIIKLHIGDPNKFDFETPKHVRDALCRAVEVNDNGYAESEGYVELRRAILEKEKQKNGVDVSIDNCVITNGVTEAIQMITAAAVDPGDEVLVPGPGYPSYTEFTKFFGGSPVAYKADEASNWQPDVDDLRKKITPKTKYIVVINPNNPTGQITNKELMLKIAQKCHEAGTVLVVDECFNEFTDEPERLTLKTELNAFPDMIILKAFTKTFAMAGIRLGYCLCSSGSTLGKIFAAGQPWSVSAVAQECGIVAFDNKEYLYRTKQLIKTEREYLIFHLNGFGFKVFGSYANYIFFQAKAIPYLDIALKEKNITIF
jgi:aspartate/methionine/tyrosine aminotransferase